MNTRDFNAGTYNIVCHSDRGQINSGSSWRLDANGTQQLGCYFGYPGVNVWVEINGKAYEKRSW